MNKTMAGMLTIKELLEEALHGAVKSLAGEEVFAGLPVDKLAFGPTKAPEHGDQATSAALILAKPLKRKPLEIAGELAEALVTHPFVAAAESAKPGFVNIRLSEEGLASVIEGIKAAAGSFGHRKSLGNGRSVLLEFVSANPTGPMHIGHCRHAATGDVLARLLSATGFQVTKEFYINDAGVQIAALGVSFHWRCLEAIGALKPGDVTEESDEKGPYNAFRGQRIQYAGEYMAEYARDFVKGKTAEQIEAMAPEDLAWEARNRNLETIKEDLAAMGVHFDRYVSEKSIHDGGAVEKTLEKLQASGQTYQQDGAVWLKTEHFGDDQDRVLVKSDGKFTYLVPDIAYHNDKYERGYDSYINVFGADHGGYLSRLRAGIATLGHNHEALTIVLLRLVFLMRDGKRVKFSKRAGNFVALSDVVEEAGPDATRWFMLSRSIDTEFDFDMDLAMDQSSKNPVYKVLYAHARICSMRDKGAASGAFPAEDALAAVTQLSHPQEKEILLHLSSYPEIVDRCARELAPHHLPAYLLGLAELLNRYYSLARTDHSFRILQDENKDRQSARLLLLDAARQVLTNGCSLLGITAPERLTRESEEEEE